MTLDDFDAMRAALGRCTFLPGSSHKRFARNIAEQTKPFTEAQTRHLIRLAWRYRRQMPIHLVPSKDAVAALDAARIDEAAQGARCMDLFREPEAAE